MTANAKRPDMQTGNHRPPGRLILAAAAALAVGLAAVYVIGGRSDNAGGPKTSVTPGKFNTGQMAAFVYRAGTETLARDFTFVDGNGKQRTLKDWSGKVVLLNLWATWCAPCRKEMPDLDALQAELGSTDFEVVAVSVDRAGLEASRKFLGSAGIKALALYADPTARLAAELKAIGLPATILIGRDGREIGRLVGPAEWAGSDAKRLVQAALR